MARDSTSSLTIRRGQTSASNVSRVTTSPPAAASRSSTSMSRGFRRTIVPATTISLDAGRTSTSRSRNGARARPVATPGGPVLWRRRSRGWHALAGGVNKGRKNGDGNQDGRAVRTARSRGSHHCLVEVPRVEIVRCHHGPDCQRYRVRAGGIVPGAPVRQRLLQHRACLRCLHRRLRPRPGHQRPHPGSAGRQARARRPHLRHQRDVAADSKVPQRHARIRRRLCHDPGHRPDRLRLRAERGRLRRRVQDEPGAPALRRRHADRHSDHRRRRRAYGARQRHHVRARRQPVHPRLRLEQRRAVRPAHRHRQRRGRQERAGARAYARAARRPQRAGDVRHGRRFEPAAAVRTGERAR